MKNLTNQALATLKKVAELETTLFHTAKAILIDPQSYHVGDNTLGTWDENTLQKAIPCAIQLIECTGESPFRHLQAIYDASDTDSGLLYPFSKLKPEPLTRIEQIYHVAQVIFGAVQPLELSAVIAELEKVA